MITNGIVFFFFQFIITFTCIISEINLLRHSVNINFESGPISVTENRGIMGQRNMLFLSQQANDFPRERDPLCWALL